MTRSCASFVEYDKPTVDCWLSGSNMNYLWNVSISPSPVTLLSPLQWPPHQWLLHPQQSLNLHLAVSPIPTVSPVATSSPVAAVGCRNSSQCSCTCRCACSALYLKRRLQLLMCLYQPLHSLCTDYRLTTCSNSAFFLLTSIPPPD